MQITTPFGGVPVSQLDLYSDEALTDPWGMYTELQNLGSAAWLTKYQMFALTRFDSVERALKDAAAFSSASGVMMNDDMNQVLRGNTLCTDGPEHQRLCKIIAKPLTASALKSLQDEIASKAEQLVDRLVAKKSFCAVTELATFLPVDIVASAVAFLCSCTTNLCHAGPKVLLSWPTIPPFIGAIAVFGRYFSGGFACEELLQHGSDS